MPILSDGDEHAHRDAQHYHKDLLQQCSSTAISYQTWKEDSVESVNVRYRESRKLKE